MNAIFHRPAVSMCFNTSWASNSFRLKTFPWTKSFFNFWSVCRLCEDDNFKNHSRRGVALHCWTLDTLCLWWHDALYHRGSCLYQICYKEGQKKMQPCKQFGKKTQNVKGKLHCRGTVMWLKLKITKIRKGLNAKTNSWWNTEQHKFTTELTKPQTWEQNGLNQFFFK